MPSNKNVSIAILSLIVASAFAVLIIGFQLAKEEIVITSEHDRKPVSSFAAQLLDEIDELTELYQSYLIDVRNGISSRSSNIEISASYRNIVGVEQVTVFREGQSSFYIDLRETDRSNPLPLPRQSGDQFANAGVVVDVTKFKNVLGDANFEWITQAGQPPHFFARVNHKLVIVLRINPEMTSAEIDGELSDWLSENFNPIKAAGIPAILRNPTGEAIASTGMIDDETAPNFLLPVPTLFGTWKISSWNKKETAIVYRQPVLIGSATLAVILVLAGAFGYSLQRRSFRLAEQRASFVNRVSHELRTPMTNILLNTDLLTDSLSDDDRSQANRLGLIREEASRLSRLIENVLTFSQHEKSKASAENSQQKLRLASCDVNQIIASVLSQFSPILTRKKLLVHQSQPDSAVFALADPDAFSQIISNLISNIEKYAADGGKFNIDIKTSSSNETVTISITDFGPGIPKSEALRIFHPFVRISDATTEGVSGTGLGLAIARDLAENLNGSLVMEPGDEKDHEGSRFILTLPLSAKNIVSIAS